MAEVTEAELLRDIRTFMSGLLEANKSRGTGWPYVSETIVKIDAAIAQSTKSHADGMEDAAKIALEVPIPECIESSSSEARAAYCLGSRNAADAIRAAAMRAIEQGGFHGDGAAQ